MAESPGHLCYRDSGLRRDGTLRTPHRPHPSLQSWGTLTSARETPAHGTLRLRCASSDAHWLRTLPLNAWALPRAFLLIGQRSSRPVSR